MNAPEYWRINLAVEKVIVRSEYEILEKKLSEFVKDNPLMAIYAAGQLAAFAAMVSARLNKIISDGKATKSKAEIFFTDDGHIVGAKGEGLTYFERSKNSPQACDVKS